MKTTALYASHGASGLNGMPEVYTKAEKQSKMYRMIRFSLILAALSAFAQDPVQITPFQLMTFDGNSGNVKACAGCSIYTYIAGSNTPSPTYTNSSLMVQNTNPVITNSKGYAAGADGITTTGIWVGTVCLKLVAKDDNSVTLWTQDNICDQAQIFIALLAGANGAAHVGFSQTGSTTSTVAAVFNSMYIWDFLYTTLSGACMAASNAGRQLLLTKTWTTLSTASLGCNIAALEGGIIQPASAQTITITGAFVDMSWSKHVDLSAGGGAQVLFSGGGTLTFEIWGVDGSPSNATDSTAACTAAYASLTQTPHTTVQWKPNGTYNINDCHVMPYVHARLNQATFTKTGSSTNGIFYTTDPGGSTYNPEVILEDGFIVGNTGVVSNCLDLVKVQVSGWARNINCSNSGGVGVRPG